MMMLAARRRLAAALLIRKGTTRGSPQASFKARLTSRTSEPTPIPNQAEYEELLSEVKKKNKHSDYSDNIAWGYWQIAAPMAVAISLGVYSNLETIDDLDNEISLVDEKLGKVTEMPTPSIANRLQNFASETSVSLSKWMGLHVPNEDVSTTVLVRLEVPKQNQIVEKEPNTSENIQFQKVEDEELQSQDQKRAD